VTTQDPGDETAPYSLRIRVRYRHGLLAQIAWALRDRGINLASAFQNEVHDRGTREIVLLTREAREDAMHSAIEDIKQLGDITGIEELSQVKP
jgi:hypothetical protein